MDHESDPIEDDRIRSIERLLFERSAHGGIRLRGSAPAPEPIETDSDDDVTPLEEAA